jgi:hypothetical protein
MRFESAARTRREEGADPCDLSSNNYIAEGLFPFGLRKILPQPCFRDGLYNPTGGGGIAKLENNTM